MSGAGTGRFVKVGRVSEIQDGRPEVFEVEDRHIAIYRLDDGYYAIEDICTHDGGPLAEGDVEGQEVICPRHGARFDIKTGAVRSMPAITPVAAYPVRVDGDDLLVGLPD